MALLARRFSRFIFFMGGMDEIVLGKYLGCSAQAFTYTRKVSGMTLDTDFGTAAATALSPPRKGLITYCTNIYTIIRHVY